MDNRDDTMIGIYWLNKVWGMRDKYNPATRNRFHMGMVYLRNTRYFHRFYPSKYTHEVT